MSATDEFHRLSFVLDTMTAGGRLYKPTERWIVVTVVRAMKLDTRGDWVCFLSLPTIAKRSGVGVRTVERLLDRHLDGAAPLLMRTYPGQTHGKPHRCARFTLVRDPEAFAAKRDHARKQLECREPSRSPAPQISRVLDESDGFAAFEAAKARLQRRPPQVRQSNPLRRRSALR